MVTYYVIFQNFFQFVTYFLSCSSDIFPLCHLASPNSRWNGVLWNKDDLLKKSFTSDFSFGILTAHLQSLNYFHLHDWPPETLPSGRTQPIHIKIGLPYSLGVVVLPGC